MKRHPYPVSFALTALAVLCLTLLAPGPARADLLYQIRSLTVGTDFVIDSLNDNGQLLYSTGGTVMQYSDGRFTQIMGTGAKAAWHPISMNQSGNAVFAMFDWDLWFAGKSHYLGTFGWDGKTRQVIPVALPGAFAIGDLSFT